MPLTTEEMQQIAVDIAVGRESSVLGMDADKFRRSLEADFRLAEERGWVVEIPSEWEVDTGFGEKSFGEKYNPTQPRVPSGSSAGGEFGAASGMLSVSRGSDGKLSMPDGSVLPDHMPKNIPPAWTDVRVNPDPKADLLVQGKDAKGRVQSVYSESHKTRQAAKKFSRVNGMRQEQKQIEQEVKADMKSPVPSIRENATVLRLIQETGIRPGGTGDTKAEKQAYGATTLEGRHVRQSTTGNVRLQFVGKKGVDINVPVTDKTLARELVNRKEVAGAKGKIFNTNSSSLRSYTKSKDGGQLHPKDFRTAKGTDVAIATMKGMKRPKTDREYKQAVRKVAKEVAAQLGNTPTVALQSYIDPTVFSKWRI
jgi:DNA topoisomerase-1